MDKLLDYVTTLLSMSHSWLVYITCSCCTCHILGWYKSHVLACHSAFWTHSEFSTNAKFRTITSVAKVPKLDVLANFDVQLCHTLRGIHGTFQVFVIGTFRVAITSWYFMHIVLSYSCSIMSSHI
jgi:hypothetical protein